MGHDHGHGSATTAHRWRLKLAFVLVASFFAVELAAGLIAQSLALISDAGHMAADVVALGAALVATKIATRPDSTGRRTYGSYRAEVFASGLAVLLMLGVSVYIVIEAVHRIGTTPDVASGTMLLVGALGLAINLICMALLRSGSHDSLTVKGAYLEVLADTLGSVGVIAAGLLVRSTGDGWWDTAVALAIAIFVGVRAIWLGREVLAVLGQHAPKDLDPQEVADALESVPDVAEVHDLHLWTLTSGMSVATAHLVTASTSPDSTRVLTDAGSLMRDRFGVDHATIQVEPPDSSACSRTSW